MPPRSYACADGRHPATDLAWDDVPSTLAHAARRIASFWPAVIVIVHDYLMRPASTRMRVLWDMNDLLGEIWMTLLAQDHHWDPARGGYGTWAGDVVRNELKAIKDRSAVPRVPHNASTRLANYRRELARSGGLPASQTRTLGALSAAQESAEDLRADWHQDTLQARESDPAEALVQAEEHAQAVRVVRLGLSCLDDREAAAIKSLYGLDEPARSPAEIAREWTRRGRYTTTYDVSVIQAIALDKISYHLTASHHIAESRS